MIWHTAIVATFFVIAAHGCPASNEPESTTLEPKIESPPEEAEPTPADVSDEDTEETDDTAEETDDTEETTDSEETPSTYMLDNGTHFYIPLPIHFK